MTWTMPPEWAPHTASWMAWPTVGPSSYDLDAAGLAAMRAAWASVANAIVPFEPVHLVVDPADVDSAKKLCDPGITVHVAPLDDSWIRDMGPTFVVDGQGRRAAVNWIFNGWGAQSWSEWDDDANIATFIANEVGVEVLDSAMVNEGGGIHVDGRGTVFLTDTVQRGEGRNPDWSREQVEAEIHRMIGTTRAVWLPRGLTRDYDDFGTRGHVDIVACFAGPDTILYHDQRSTEHPDHEVSAEVAGIMGALPGIDVIPVAAPTVLTDDRGCVDYSYINHYVVNGAVILCSFDDPNDEAAKETLAHCYPDREIVLVDARGIFDRGGGIHCITQQEPAG